MARTMNPATIGKMIDGLRTQRRDLVAKLARIDDMFASLGISAEGAASRRGRPPGAKAPKAVKAGKRGRRKRGSFAISGEESVLAFVKKHGKPNAKEVNAHWQGEGRGGKADNTLGKLIAKKLIKRVPGAKDERGSRYAAV